MTLAKPMVNAEACKSRVSSSTQPLCTVAPGRIPVLSSTLVSSEEASPVNTAALQSNNQLASKKAGTNAVSERTTMLSQWATVTAPNGQKVQHSTPSLISLSMRTFG